MSLTFISRFGHLIRMGLVRWMEMLGQNPPLSRDHGIYAWHYLHEVSLRSPRTPKNGPDQPAGPRHDGLLSTWAFSSRAGGILTIL